MTVGEPLEGKEGMIGGSLSIGNEKMGGEE